MLTLINENVSSILEMFLKKVRRAHVYVYEYGTNSVSVYQCHIPVCKVIYIFGAPSLTCR